MEHRKRNGTNAWHWRPECSQWPNEDFARFERRPYHGELCSECLTGQTTGPLRHHPDDDPDRRTHPGVTSPPAPDVMQAQPPDAAVSGTTARGVR